jgi:phosphoglucomutase
VNAVDIFHGIKIIDEDKAIKSGLLIYLDEKIDNRYIEEVEKAAIRRDLPNKDKFKIVYSPLHGTARVPVQRVLKEMGYTKVYTVPEQEMPDGNFPTCSYANPEDKNVFKLSVKLADEIGANICLANDPDGDRVGIAIKDKNNNWHYPNGNQIGILLLDYILKSKKDIPKNGAVVTTIVSTPMIDVIADDYKLKVFRTLTGFKYIGEKIKEFENKKYDAAYVFGFEESIGYLINTHVRDKDAVVSSMLIVEMATYYDSIGSDIFEELNKIYDKYGWYKESTVSVTKEGKTGLEEITNIMDKLRTTKHNVIAGKKAITYRDFQLSIEKKSDGTENILDLPKSNVIQFILEDGSYVTARPSGTEPKIKYYICVVDKTEEKVDIRLESVEKEFQEYISTL